MVYKDTCGSDHYSMVMENTIIENPEQETIPKFHDRILKSKLVILQKWFLTTLIPKINANQEEHIIPKINANQEELIIHFTNILITIVNKIIPLNYNISKTQQTIFYRGVQNHKRTSSYLQEIQNKPFIRKSKQI